MKNENALVVGSVLLITLSLMSACSSDDGVVTDATTSDLQTSSFTFDSGEIFDPALDNQSTTLQIGAFDGSNTAPFSLQSGGLTASGTASLQSPLTLSFRVIDQGLPFSVGQEILYVATIHPGVVLGLTKALVGSAISDRGVNLSSAPRLVQTVLSGGQEAPAVTTSGTGSASFSLNEDRTEISYTLQYSGMSSTVSQAHIHIGGPGVLGPINLFLCTNLANGPVGTEPACPSSPGTVTGTLTDTNFIAAGGLTTFAEAVDALLAGNTYTNVHSQTNPGGEIRGQNGAAQIASVSSGDQEVAPVTTTGTGSATYTLSETQTAISYTLEYANVADVTQAHIHVAGTGVNGPITLFLCTNLANGPTGAEPACTTSPRTVNGVITA